MALNKFQWLICHKTKAKQTTPLFKYPIRVDQTLDTIIFICATLFPLPYDDIAISQSIISSDKHTHTHIYIHSDSE